MTRVTLRRGRLRRQEAAFVVADPRFSRLVESVEASAGQLDKVGLENRKWAYHKLKLPSEYRARAALSVRLLDQARDLQGDLMDAVDVEEILVTVEDQGDVFNKVNVSTAIHRIARLATTKMPGVVPVDVNSVISDGRFARLVTMAESTVGEMAIVSVSNVLWALARMHYPAPASLVDALASRAASTMDSAEPRHVSTVMWALAVLGHEPRSKLLAATATIATQRAEAFLAPDIVNALWAHARWHRSVAGGAGAAETVAALSAVALGNLPDFTPYQCANLAWSLAMLDAPLPAGALGRVAERAASDPARLDDTALTHALWAVGVKGTEMDGNSGAFKTLLSEAAARAGERRIGRAGAAGVIWACGRLKATPRPGEADQLLRRVIEKGERGEMELEAQSLVHAVWGVSHMEGVRMSEADRESVLRHARRLTKDGYMSDAHAETMTNAATGAGIDPRAMQQALLA